MKINQRAILLIGLSFVWICCFALFSGWESENRTKKDDGTSSETDAEIKYMNVAGYEIALWQQEDLFFAFLPSACKGRGLEPEIPDTVDPDSIVYLYSENIPSVFIDTESGTMEQLHADKNIKEAGSVSVLEADGRTGFRMPLSYIKSRGNTSFTSLKRSPIRLN